MHASLAVSTFTILLPPVTGAPLMTCYLESDYFYPTHLGPLEKAAGNLLDPMAATVRNMI